MDKDINRRKVLLIPLDPVHDVALKILNRKSWSQAFNATTLVNAS
jgi:hypothetical protein